MIDDKKKKRGLIPMLGLDQGTDYVASKPAGILPTAESELNERDQETSVGSRVRDRMTGQRRNSG